MSLISLNDNQHIILDLYAERDLKGFLLAILKNNVQQSGCYVYFGENKTVLYVGKSDSLFSRLVQHKKSKIGFETVCDDWTALGVVFSDNAILTERELIRQFQPQHNKLGNES